jgi:phosphate/sulfate permease
MVNISSDEKERVRLVELDYDKTNDFIKGVVGTGALLRGSAITVWLALIGFAFQQSLMELAIFSAVVVLVFLIVDGYYGWLYAQAATHLRAVEKVTSTYYNALSRGEDDDDALHDFQQELRFHRFGLFLNLRSKLKWTFLREARPRVIYRVVYPFMLGVAIAAAIAIGPLEVGKQEHKATTQEQAIAVVTALTVSQRAELTKLSVELSRSRTPEDRQLGEEVSEVLRAVPGAIAAVASFSHAADDIAEKAIGLVLEAVSRVGISGGADATFNVDNSRVTNSDVSGPDFTFNAGGETIGPIRRQAAVDCVTYLGELDQLLDDEPKIASQLPGRSVPLDAGAKACGLTSPLGVGSEIVKLLAKR